MCLPSHYSPHCSLIHNSVLCLSTRLAPERLLGSDRRKPHSVSLAIIRSLSRGRLETLRAGLGAFGKEAISSPDLGFISLEGQVPKITFQLPLWSHKHNMAFSVFNSKIQIRAVKEWFSSLDIFLILLQYFSFLVPMALYVSMYLSCSSLIFLFFLYSSLFN